MTKATSIYEREDRHGVEYHTDQRMKALSTQEFTEAYVNSAVEAILSISHHSLGTSDRRSYSLH
jgi:hypothetical protein